MDWAPPGEEGAAGGDEGQRQRDGGRTATEEARRREKKKKSKTESRSQRRRERRTAREDETTGAGADAGAALGLGEGRGGMESRQEACKWLARLLAARAAVFVIRRALAGWGGRVDVGRVMDEAETAYTRARRELWASGARPRFTEEEVRVHAEDAEVRLAAERARLRATGGRGSGRKRRGAGTSSDGGDGERASRRQDVGARHGRT